MEKSMIDYIRETPIILNNIIRHSHDFTNELVEFYHQNACKGITLIASGSSYNGCLIALPFLKHLGMDVELHTPFTFIHHQFPIDRNRFYLAVSQSGCSTNILEALKTLKQNRQPCASLTGRKDCDAIRIADLTVDWQAGEEKVGFVTKGVSSLSCFLMCFGLELALYDNRISKNRYASWKKELKKTQILQPEMLQNTIAFFDSHRQFFSKPSEVILLSSGPGFGVASEGALKIAETSCIRASAFEAEEFLHGPLYPSTPDVLFIIIGNEESSSTKRIMDIAAALEDISEKILILGNDERFDKTHCVSPSEETASFSSPLYKLTCLQTLAYLMTINSNQFEPHECVKKFKKANKVASKSRDSLYLDLQKIG